MAYRQRWNLSILSLANRQRHRKQVETLSVSCLKHVVELHLLAGLFLSNSLSLATSSKEGGNLVSLLSEACRGVASVGWTLDFRG